jgi:hypothetical protein
MSKKLSPLLSILLCSGCNQTLVVKTIKPPQLLTSLSLPTLATVKQAATVEIQNDWNGYSDITPVLRHYKLKLHQQQLVGNAYIAVGGYGAAGIHQQRTTKVKIPAAIVSKFLTTLSTTPLQIGAYKPTILKTDDYPEIGIKITIDQQQITFSSKSQGVDRIPWQVAITENNTTTKYISNSPIPAQAFRQINSILDRSGVDQILQRRRQRKQK